MTWFKVDDKMWSHPKVLHASSLALGVWVRVGSYCADQLTDGLVAVEMSCSCGWRAEVWDRFFLDTDMPASLLVYYHSECC